MKVYVVVLENRHVDGLIELFRSAKEAMDYVDELKDEYPNEEWETEDIDIEGWIYHARSTCDDGPTVRIEEKEL